MTVTFQPVEFSSNVRPVCLPDRCQMFEGATAYTTGWGDTNPGSSFVPPQNLQETEVTVCMCSMYM